MHDKMAEWNDNCSAGSPRYQVDISGQHLRQVHIDHLQPRIRIHKDIATLTGEFTDIPCRD